MNSQDASIAKSMHCCCIFNNWEHTLLSKIFDLHACRQAWLVPQFTLLKSLAFSRLNDKHTGCVLRIVCKMLTMVVLGSLQGCLQSRLGQHTRMCCCVWHTASAGHTQTRPRPLASTAPTSFCWPSTAYWKPLCMPPPAAGKLLTLLSSLAMCNFFLHFQNRAQLMSKPASNIIPRTWASHGKQDHILFRNLYKIAAAKLILWRCIMGAPDVIFIRPHVRFHIVFCNRDSLACL